MDGWKNARQGAQGSAELVQVTKLRTARREAAGESVPDRMEHLASKPELMKAWVHLLCSDPLR